MSSTDPVSIPLFDLGRLHHIGVVVDDIEEAAHHLEQVYGVASALFAESVYACRIDGVPHAAVHRLGLSIGGPPHVELLRSVPGTSVWQPSPGVHHLGFVVDDVAVACAELERRGASLWMGGVRDSRCPTGTAYLRDPLGMTVELLDRTTERRLAERLAANAPTEREDS